MSSSAIIPSKIATPATEGGEQIKSKLEEFYSEKKEKLEGSEPEVSSEEEKTEEQDVEQEAKEAEVEEPKKEETESEKTEEADESEQKVAETEEFTPRLKYKVDGEEKDFPDWAHSFVKDAEGEAKFKELFEKAEGVGASRS